MKFIQALLFIIFFPIFLPFYLFSYLKKKENVNEIETNSNKNSYNNIIENNFLGNKSDLKEKLKNQEEKILQEQKRNKTVSTPSKSNPFSVISSNRKSYNINNIFLNNLNLKNEIKLDLKEKLQNQINKKINIIEDYKSDELIIKGNRAELEIFKVLIENVNNSLFVFNPYIEKENESTEIDLIMLHQSGLYVFEIKNFNGWIFGSENDKTWTCTYRRNGKEKFFNPIWQNKKHINYLKTILGSKNIPIYNYVVFGRNSELKSINLNSKIAKVISINEIKKEFKDNNKLNNITIKEDELVEIFNLLYSLSERTEDYKEKHNLQIKNRNGDLITDYSVDNLQLKPKFKTILKSQIENKINIISTTRDEELKNNYIFELNIFNKLKDINKVIFLFNVELKNESRIIMLHYSGIYLFEVVNCKGWLYGEEKSYNWTCTYFNNKEKEKVVFYNPIFNNKENIEKIQTLLGSKKYPIYNYIILNNNLTLKNKNFDNKEFKILYYSDIDKHFKETDRITKNKINKEELKEIIFKLYPLSKVKNQSV